MIASNTSKLKDLASQLLEVLKNKIKSGFESIKDNKVKQNILNALPFWVGAVLTGLVAVVYAKLFSWAEQGTHYIFHYNKWLFFIITPIAFVLSWGLVNWKAPYSKGSGIPQLGAAIDLSTPKNHHLINHFLSFRIIIVKIISSLILVLGGGAIGREGPTIQISGSIFKIINDFLPSWYPKISRKNMLITGGAAGLAAAFNTPLGGIVFAIEELTKTHFNYFKSALITGVIISGITALNILGPYLYLGYPEIKEISLWIVFPILLVALIAGLFASSMGRFILFINKKKTILKNTNQKVVYSIFAGLILASLGVFISLHAFGSGKEIMVNTLFTNEKNVDWYMPFLRFFSTSISFTNGAAGGIFAPSLGAGASVGSVISGWFDLSSSNTNLMILCGMVSFLTGITRSPFTSSILVLEMTNSYNLIFYLMLAGLVGNLVSNFIDRQPFYEHLKNQFLEEVINK